MTSQQALEKLKELESVKGKQIILRGDNQKPFKVNVIIAAPSNLTVFTKYYREFIESNESAIRALPNGEYDLYFYNDPYATISFFVRYNDFIENYIVL